MKNDVTVKELKKLQSMIGEIMSDLTDMKGVISSHGSTLKAICENREAERQEAKKASKASTRKARPNVETVKTVDTLEGKKEIGSAVFKTFFHSYETRGTVKTALVILPDKTLRKDSERVKELREYYRDLYGTKKVSFSHMVGFDFDNKHRASGFVITDCKALSLVTEGKINLPKLTAQDVIVIGEAQGKRFD